ncbi:MAG: BON domain-containing protein [Phycisphaeraceae bacterium]|nr:BON domain-containing protein [Phycisphaeraceae bacterium]
MNLKLLTMYSTLGACIFVGACDTRSETPAPAPAPTRSPETVAPAPDNTEVNKVDSKSATKTPMDQSNSKADIDITASIRRAIMEDKAMSINAQNCKIITEDGVTTLRGPVNSQAEKDSIEAKAKAVAGVTRVDNQLEVKTK